METCGENLQFDIKAHRINNIVKTSSILYSKWKAESKIPELVFDVLGGVNNAASASRWHYAAKYS